MVQLLLTTIALCALRHWYASSTSLGLSCPLCNPKNGRDGLKDMEFYVGILQECCTTLATRTTPCRACSTRASRHSPIDSIASLLRRPRHALVVRPNQAPWDGAPIHIGQCKIELYFPFCNCTVNDGLAASYNRMCCRRGRVRMLVTRLMRRSRAVCTRKAEKQISAFV